MKEERSGVDEGRVKLHFFFFLHLLLFSLFAYEYSCILCKIFKGIYIVVLMRACAYLSLPGNCRQYCKKDTFEQGKRKGEGS